MSKIEYIPREAALARKKQIELIRHTATGDERIVMDVVQVCDIQSIPPADVVPTPVRKEKSGKIFYDKKCAVCGATFHVKAPNEKYCSLTCKESARIERAENWKAANPGYHTEYMRQYRARKKRQANGPA